MAKKTADNDSKKEKPEDKPKKSHKLFWCIVIIAVLVALIFFSTKIYLVVNLLLGNDIVIKLSSDRESLSLVHGQPEQIRFNSYILTNPFCSAECTSEFIDLGKNQLIEAETFNMTPAITKSKEYSISSPALGEGQEYYRFNIKCRGISTFLCHTSEENKSKTLMLVVNYGLNNEEQEEKNLSKRLISEMIQESNSFDSEIQSISQTLDNITTLDKTYFADELKKVKQLNTDFKNSAFNLKQQWENQKYDLFPPENAVYETVPSELNIRLNSLNKSLSENISKYNALIDSLNLSKQELERLNQLNLSNESLIKREDAIAPFNNAIDAINSPISLERKQNIVQNISIPQLNNENTTSLASMTPIRNIPEKLGGLVSVQPSQINISFTEPIRRCCLFGKCGQCCENCADKNYPVILLHGHAFNKKISAEYSLDTFQGMSEKLEENGWLNAGSILISQTEKGIWSQFNLPLTMAASYYFDVYKNPKQSSIIQTKSDSLDTYALRLKDIIDVTKYKTGKNKVIIIAHSMGGLVVRKYIQIFGEDEIEKVIFIGTPNQGIEPGIQQFCTIIGESLECRDMAKDSLFINKLSYAEPISIPAYNIIGIGCGMGNETGDGIVTRSGAYLEGAKNYDVKGACNDLKFEFLHTNLVNPEKSPEVFDIILKALK
jgi:pimeloyl-ACP methyl ester carboxylesterase